MGPPDRLRRQLTLIAVGFPLLALIASAGLGMPDGATREFGCWVLPNARVLVTPGDEACPLRSHDQIRRVEAEDGTIHSVASGRAVARLVAGCRTRRAFEGWGETGGTLARTDPFGPIPSGRNCLTLLGV